MPDLCLHIQDSMYWLSSRITYNPTRYPKYIPEAYCLCKGCLTGPFGEENLNFRSTPVYMPTVILRRTSSCTGGRYVYVEDYITIPVGCTCVPDNEKESETDSANSSLEKEKFKVSINKSEKPSSNWAVTLCEERCVDIVGFGQLFIISLQVQWR